MSPSLDRRHGWLLCIALVGAVLAALIVWPTPAAPQRALEPQLPDLDQAVPSQLSVITARRGGRTLYRLAFRSAVENRGVGTLVVVGHRSSRRTSFMTADQYVDLFDPHTGQTDTQSVVPNVGRMRYVVSEDHQHWHYVHFERYELRRASNNRLVSPDRKSGFCIGNRYIVRGAARAATRITFRDFDTHCGQRKPSLLRVVVGLNPGSGDDYKPVLEGQFVDLTRVPGGRYLLVHKVNVDRKIQESDYTDNAASVLVSLKRRPGRRPTIRVLARCPDTPRCPAR